MSGTRNGYTRNPWYNQTSYNPNALVTLLIFACFAIESKVHRCNLPHTEFIISGDLKQLLFHSSHIPSEPQLTKIKVCGITRLTDALSAAEHGADALGFVFYPPSPRNLEIGQARAILDYLPESVSSVAVMADPDDALLAAVVSQVRPDYLQFHGVESPLRCQASGLPYLKGFRVRRKSQIKQEAAAYIGAHAILLDAYAPDKVGGTGETFAWDRVPSLRHKVILAGGLNAGNVDLAMRTIRPYAVDVSSGVESAPGIKDAKAIGEFVKAVRRSDQLLDSA